MKVRFAKVGSLLLALLLAFASLFGMAACEGSPSDNGGDDEPEAEGYFKSFTITDGDLLVYGRTENLNKAQEFFAESVQGLFAQKGESKYYHYRPDAYETWLNETESEYGKGNTDVTVAQMLADYKANIGTGYVLYDSTDGESTNCARTVAGAEGIAMVDDPSKIGRTRTGLSRRSTLPR